jgi:hypothetical protein
MNCVSQEKCPGTHRHTVFITLLFASAYLYKEMFTGIKHVKCMTRSRITKRHLEIRFALVIRPLCVTLGVFFVRSSAKSHIDILVSEEK